VFQFIKTSQGFKMSPNELYKNFAIVVPSTTQDLPMGRTRGIKVDGSGNKSNIAIHDEAGNSVIITGLANNVIHPISTTRVLVTGTTATSVVVFW